MYVIFIHSLFTNSSLQTHTTRNFLYQNHKKIVYFYLYFSLTHARYALLISLKFMQITCQKYAHNFWCLIKISNFVSFWDIWHKIKGNWKKRQKFRLFEWNSWSLHSVDHFKMLMSRSLGTCASPRIFFLIFHFI